MRYDAIKRFSCEDFRRLDGSETKNLWHELGVLTIAEKKKHEKGGKWSSHPPEDRLLMALEYLREYRKFFHVAAA